MKLTREEALKLHRQMWTDMQTELEDNPPGAMRIFFKEKWKEKHFPGEVVSDNCFLCEVTRLRNCGGGCSKCPIVWPCGRCFDHHYYYNAPISEILALPEREVNG